MGIRQPSNLKERVTLAAERALKSNGSVGPIELLIEMDLLNVAHVNDWKHGRESAQTLRKRMQGNPEKLAKAFTLFQEWAREKNLKTVEASYTRATAHGVEELRVCEEDDPGFERFCRTHYASANLSAKQTERLEKKLNKAPELVCFFLTSTDAACQECGAKLEQGELMFLENQQPLCLACADLDHLEFLPSGDAALTRRAKKHSPLSAVAVQFNRRRKRYERQGLLATPDAIAQAELECADDAEERAARRVKDAERRREEDKEYVADLTRAIRAQFPRCPPDEAQQIAAHTAARGSGRIGRSAAAKELAEGAVDLAVGAWVRHQHTDYDNLLMEGVERQAARRQIADTAQAKLREWR